MKRIVYFLVSLLGFTKLAAQDPADFVLPSIISDHAVMQRDAEVKLWGWCPSVWDLKIVCDGRNLALFRSVKYGVLL